MSTLRAVLEAKSRSEETEWARAKRLRKNREALKTATDIAIQAAKECVSSDPFDHIASLTALEEAIDDLEKLKGLIGSDL